MMDAAQFFLLRYEPLHALMTDRLFADLSDAQLRARDPARIRRAVRTDGDYGPKVDPERVEAFYGGMTRGWAFAHMALTHTFGHFAEANIVRGMLGFPGV